MTCPSDFLSYRLRNTIPRTASHKLMLGLICAGLCLAGIAPVHALAAVDSQQTKPYALIFGTVWGPDGRPVSGVRIKIRKENEKKTRWELNSDRRGEFAQRVPVGKADYIIWPDLKGFKSADGKRLEGQEITVHVEYDERVDTGLHLK